MLKSKEDRRSELKLSNEAGRILFVDNDMADLRQHLLSVLHRGSGNFAPQTRDCIQYNCFVELQRPGPQNGGCLQVQKWKRQK